MLRPQYVVFHLKGVIFLREWRVLKRNIHFYIFSKRVAVFKNLGKVFHIWCHTLRILEIDREKKTTSITPNWEKFVICANNLRTRNLILVTMYGYDIITSNCHVYWHRYPSFNSCLTLTNACALNVSRNIFQMNWTSLHEYSTRL